MIRNSAVSVTSQRYSDTDKEAWLPSIPTINHQPGTTDGELKSPGTSGSRQTSGKELPGDKSKGMPKVRRLARGSHSGSAAFCFQEKDASGCFYTM